MYIYLYYIQIGNNLDRLKPLDIIVVILEFGVVIFKPIEQLYA